MSRLALIFILLAASHTGFAASPVSTPEQVAAAISRDGAEAFLASLNYDEIDELMNRIGSGQSAWIALAPKLAEGADAANAEGLGIELAYSLPKNPAAVLKVVTLDDSDSPVLQVSRVCGVPFIETVPRGYKARALRALKKLNDPSLRQMKDRCINALLRP